MPSIAKTLVLFTLSPAQMGRWAMFCGLLVGLTAGQGAAQTVDQPATESTAKPNPVEFDAQQTAPLLTIYRQLKFQRNVVKQVMLQLSADGKLVARKGEPLEQRLQLDRDQIDKILQLAVNEAQFFELDSAELQQQIYQRATGSHSFEVGQQPVTIFKLQLGDRTNELKLQGFNLARLKLPDFQAIQKLAAVDSYCTILVAQKVVGPRLSKILQQVNAKALKRKLPLPNITAENLRAANESKGGRLQVRFEVSKKQPTKRKQVTPGPSESIDSKIKAARANRNLDDGVIRINYFIKQKDAAPQIRFYGKLN